MACKDCLLNCPDIVSDQCVQYTGPTIPILGICQGDQLSEFENQIATELVGILNGTGIEPDNVTFTCTFLQDIIGVASPTLSNILQTLITASCTLKDLIDEINTQISNNPVFNTNCLTGLPTSPTRDDILQAVVNLVCTIKTTVDAIPTTYVKSSDLTTLVTQIVTQINGGGTTIIQNNTKMVPFSVMAYFGPLSNFAADGTGVASLGFQKIYLCNGQNGTPDLRGRVIVGAVRNVPGGTLDPIVDPAVTTGAISWALNDKGGEPFHTLTVSEIPTHTHTVNDPGHRHLYTFGNDSGGNKNSANWMKLDSDNNSKQTQTATTGISINSTGGGQAHNNYQPSVSGYYIMYIP